MDQFPTLRAFKQQGHQTPDVAPRLRSQLQLLEPVLNHHRLDPGDRRFSPAWADVSVNKRLIRNPRRVAGGHFLLFVAAINAPTVEAVTGPKGCSELIRSTRACAVGDFRAEVSVGYSCTVPIVTPRLLRLPSSPASA